MDLACGLPKIVKIDNLRPAQYNPRTILDDQVRELCASIEKFGVVIPIIANGKDGTIVAGHQRFKCCEILKIQEVPCVIAPDIDITDEVRLNQLHNGTFGNKASCSISTEHEGFRLQSPGEFGNFNCSASLVKEACGLMMRYGNIFSAVVVGGKVIYGSEYIKACQLLGASQCLCYFSDPNQGLQEAISKQYGSYCYDHLPKNTYVQGLAQLYRSVKNTPGKKSQASTLYVNHVLGSIRKGDRILDFGCGKGDYVNFIRANGVSAIGIEFYPNNGKSIQVSDGKRMIEAVLRDIKDHGLYDIVVCDSVLNSVDSVEAESSVMATCCALTKNLLFISGRPLDAAISHMKSKHDRYVSKRFVEFIDKDGFTATFRSGNWYYQHYQTRDQVARLVEEHGMQLVRLDWRKNGDSWQAACKKINRLSDEVIAAGVSYEFSLPLPGGERYDYSQQAVDIIIAAQDSD